MTGFVVELSDAALAALAAEVSARLGPDADFSVVNDEVALLTGLPWLAVNDRLAAWFDAAEAACCL